MEPVSVGIDNQQLYEALQRECKAIADQEDKDAEKVISDTNEINHELLIQRWESLSPFIFDCNTKEEKKRVEDLNRRIKELSEHFLSMMDRSNDLEMGEKSAFNKKVTEVFNTRAGSVKSRFDDDVEGHLSVMKNVIKGVEEVIETYTPTTTIMIDRHHRPNAQDRTICCVVS